MKREELIKRIQSWNLSHDDMAALAEVIPELRESEDERIRRTLVEYFGPQAQLDFIRGVPIQKIRDWLEKQKEQIPYTDFVIKPHKGDDNNPYDMRVSEAQEYAIKRGFGVPFNDGEVYVDERHMTQTIGNIIRWADEHPKEQKQSETEKEYVKTLKGLVSDFIRDTGGGITDVAYYQKICDWLEGRHIEQKQEWSKEDKDVIDEAAELALGWGCPNLSAKLKSILSCVKPAEWSEEDERILKGIIGKIDHNQTYGVSMVEMLSFLKDLRPSWKPSEDEERLINTSISFLKDFADKGYENAVECIDWLKSKLNGNNCE